MILGVGSYSAELTFETPDINDTLVTDSRYTMKQKTQLSSSWIPDPQKL